MNRVADEFKQKYGLNYSILATPAEGLSGRFTRIDRKKYGIIPGVTDRDYYVNSFHVDVKEPISIVEKNQMRGTVHALTRGGHIRMWNWTAKRKRMCAPLPRLSK